jgi:hypothetical protein
MPAPDRVEKHVRAWLEDFVVGLNLCPFARPYVLQGALLADSLRIALCGDTQPEALRRAFLEESNTLQSSSEREIATSLLVFPHALSEFTDYLDFFDEAQDLLMQAGLEGLIQLASFHPLYEFEGEEPNGASHFSNRAPYPVIHLLREDMMERVLLDFPHPERIPEDNIKALEQIGSTELRRRWEKAFV